MWKPYSVKSIFDIREFYSAFIRVCDREYFFPGESHDFWEMLYVIKGEVCMSADEKIITLNEGGLIFHKPMEFHSIRTNADKPTDFFVMSFSCDGDFVKVFENSIFRLGRKQKKELFDIIELFKMDPKSGEIMPTVYLDTLFKSPIKVKLLKNLTENFLVSLSETGESDTPLVNNTETVIYAEALKIIDAYLYKKLPLNQLASMCHVSLSYLKKIFAKYNGLGIHEYILKNKITAAKQFLSEGETVTEVSERLAFSSQNYFSTAFKRETGISPKNFQNLR